MHLHRLPLFPSLANLWPAWEHGVSFDRWSLVGRLEWGHVFVTYQDSMAIDAVEIALSIEHPVMAQVDCGSNREHKLIKLIERSCDFFVCICVKECMYINMRICILGVCTSMKMCVCVHLPF